MSVTISLVLVGVGGCDKGATANEDKPAASKPTAKADDREPQPATAEEAGKPEPSVADPAAAEPTPEPVVTGPTAGAGFTLGATPASTDALEGMIEEQPPVLVNGDVSVKVSAHGVAGSDGSAELFLRARVEFTGADASAGLNHERAATDSEIERVFLGLDEVAKLPDGRWVVDARLTGAIGEDSLSATTDHSVIIIDPSRKTAALIWTGTGTSLSEMGVCMSDSWPSFAVVGDELVVSKTESTEFDAELAVEYGMEPGGCEPKPKTTTEVARTKLAGP